MQEHILIAMPCAHATVKVETMTSVTYTALALAPRVSRVAVATLSGYDLVFMRNYLAGTAVRDEFTHILFVDSDMFFPPEPILRMLDSGKEVVGLVYPRRTIDLAGLVRLSRERPELPAEAIISMNQTYVVRLVEAAAFTDGFSKVAGLGMGATLIATSALRRMIETGAVVSLPPKMNIADTTVPLWSFFNYVQSETGGELSEDNSFCKRWSDIGGEVWALAAPGVQHIGDFKYSGDILAKGSEKIPGSI